VIQVRLIVMAKAPVSGRSKTRLCPPCTGAEAARLAEAALQDTLAAVASAPVERRVLALAGRAGDWVPPNFDVLRQRGDGLANRLAHAFAAVGGPSLLIGMDTPQVTSAMLAEASAKLLEEGTDAVLGPAPDGGYWAIGLTAADAAVFRDVPMSSSRTAAAQRERLRALGLRHAELRTLRDVDTIDDARAVAAEAPASRFARALARLRHVSPTLA